MSDQIAELFANKQQYWTPTYQRRYVWDKKNWEALWRDLRQLQKQIDDGKKHKQHFTGTIVTQPYENSQEKYEIIDGQQRLTTFQIIFCVIRDLCASGIYPSAITSEIKSDVAGFAKLSALQMGKPGKLENSGNGTEDEFSSYRLLISKDRDKDAFKSVVSGKLLEQINNRFPNILEGFKSLNDDPPPDQNPIITAYGFFATQITDYLEEKGVDRLLNLTRTFSYHFHVNHANLGTNDEAQQVFESINDTGKPLDEFDLLRNDLFLRAKDREKKILLYEEHWRDFDEDPFWEVSGMTDQFFRDFLVAKLGPMLFYNNRLFHDLYKGQYHAKLEIELNLDDTNHREFVKKEFEELSKYAKSYQEIENRTTDIGICMQFYDDLKITSLRPFILYLKNELNTSNTQLEDVCDILESYIMRRMVNYGYGTNDKDEDGYTKINSYFSKLIAGTKFSVGDFINLLHDRESNSPTSWPANGQILGGRRSRNRSGVTAGGLQRTADEIHFGKHSSYSAAVSLLRYIFYRIERYITEENTLSFKNFLDTPTRINILDDEDRDWRSIGNLTFRTENGLSEEMVNNFDFDETKKVLSQHPNASLKINRDICEYENWEVERIKDQTQKLGSYFCEIWPNTDSLRRKIIAQSIRSNPEMLYDGEVKSWNTKDSRGYIEFLELGQSVEVKSDDLDPSVISGRLYRFLKVKFNIKIVEKDEDLQFHAYNVIFVTTGELHEGIVKTFEQRNGYGFLTLSDYPNDIYLHRTEVRSADINILREGQNIKFVLAETVEDKLPIAINVKLVRSWH